MKRIFLSLVAVFVLQLLFGGVRFAGPIVKGKVYEMDNNNQKVALPFVNVFLEGTSLGTITNNDGIFQLEIPEGKVRMFFSFIGYKTVSREVEILDKRQQVFLEVFMEVDGEQLDEVKVTAKVNRESENMLLLEQKKAAVAVENIGARELSRKGVSDVAAGVKKVAGVSLVGSKQLFVRGLGDRYNNAQLNGLPIASPNSDKKLVPLDLFPTSVVKNLGVSKVFSAKNYADFSGGTINIETKDYSVNPFLEMDVSVGMNSQTTFSNFKSGDNPGNGYFGFDLSSRRLPGEVKSNDDRYPEYEKDPFPSTFGVDQNDALPEFSFGVTGGNGFYFKNGDQLGFIFSAHFSNDYLFSDGRFVRLTNDGNIYSQFDYRDYEYDTRSSVLASMNYQFNDDHQLTYNLLFLNRTEDEYREDFGEDAEENKVLSNVAVNRVHRLINNQLIGKHKLSDRVAFDWRGSYAIASSDEPDRKNIVYEVEDDNSFTLFSLNQQETLRYFGELEEKELSGVLNFDFTLGQEERGNFNVGVQGRRKSRDFESYKYYYYLKEIDDIPVDPDFPEELINDDAFADGSIYLQRGHLPRDRYDASLDLIAGYGELVYNLSASVLLNAGLRLEQGRQEVTYFDDAGRPDTSLIKGLDLFPSLNLKVAISERVNWRLGMSRTITRPDFKEMAPFQYRESYGGETTRGNADLENAFNYNLDLKYELFPNPGELFSLGFYGKYLDRSIERVQFFSAGVGHTFENADRGMAAGIEMEVKKKFKDLFLGLNASYIYTNVSLPEDGAYTLKERSLQGASPYLINADVAYPISFGKDNEMSLAAVYNIYGKRIYSVGVNGAGDIYEMPFNSLDFLYKLKFNNGLRCNFSVKNMINQEHVFKQDILQDNGRGDYSTVGNVETNSYKNGINLSIGFSYTF